MSTTTDATIGTLNARHGLTLTTDSKELQRIFWEY